mgnify:FL=1
MFFADPYCPWERGTNENTNGLLQEYFPKKLDFSKINQINVNKVLNLLNNRPRKCLNIKHHLKHLSKKSKTVALNLTIHHK